jgi:type II secretory pathway pseudopilin PulG
VGFTLVELVLVIGLLALLAGLVGPDLVRHWQRARIEDMAQTLRLMTRETFHAAIFSGQGRFLTASPAHWLTIRKDSPAGPSVDEPWLRPISMPGWCRVEGLEEGWGASPEGFCDPGPLVVRDLEQGTFRSLRFRSYDAEVSDEAEPTPRR